MSVIGNAITLGGGSGGGADKLMNQGQVSNTSDYKTAYFDAGVDLSEYDILEFRMFRGGVDVGGSAVIRPSSYPLNFTITGGGYTYSMRLQSGSIACTNYAGSFVNLFVDVYGYHR